MEEMQGIMTLPQSGAASAPADPQQEAMFQKLRQEVPPKQFGDELLGAASQADPQAVKAFVDELRSLEVPMDTLVTLNEMVDAILANPQDYARIRRQYMAQGIPEDVLPERFDAMFFAALNMALDQLTMQQAPPVGMAGGGIADLAQYGRHGDTMLAHITPEEAALLKSRGGSGTINPVTGLPEFFIKKLFKSIGNAVKKFAQSTIGRIVLPIALGFFLGPAAMQLVGVQAGTLAGTAVSAFTGSATAAALRGENLRDVLKSGATGAVMAGVAGEVFGHPGATQAGATVASGAATGVPGAATGVPEALPSVSVPTVPDQIAMLEANMAPQGPGIDGSGIVMGPRTNFIRDAIYKPSLDANLVQEVMGSSSPPQAYAPFAPRAAPPPAPSEGLSFQESMARGPLSEMAARPVQGPTDLYREAIAPPGGNAYAGTPPVGIGQTISPSGNMPPLPPPGTEPGFTLRQPFYSANAANSMYAEPGSAAFDAMSKNLSELNLPAPGNMPPPPPPGTEPGFMDKAKGLYDKYLNPKTLGEVPQDVVNKAETAYLQKLRETGNKDLANKAYDAIIKAGTPGILSTYGPLAAVGLGATALAGGFKTKPVEMPLGKPETGFDRLKQYPERYNLSFGGISGTRSYYNPYTAGLLSPPRAADGGIMSLEVGGRIHPRKTGHITGPGTSTSDSIPALLSDGEFVFTAKAVRAMGQGSRRKGAKRLYSMMKMLEKRQG